MDKAEMNEIKENVSEFVFGLFSLSSLVLKILSFVDNFKTRKKINEKNSKLVEEKNN